MAIVATTIAGGATASASPTQQDPPAAACEGESVTLPSGATLCDGGSAAPEATTAADGPFISMVKTVGTDPMACADTTGITITAATTRVIYCYTVTNTGTVPFTSHDLTDDKLGVLLDDYAFDLQPGGTTYATAAATLDGSIQTIVNTGSWTATDGTQSANSQAQATVTVVDGASAPAPVTATAAEGQASVAWTVPSSNGGHPITGYRITVVEDGAPSATVDVGAGVLAQDVTGLTNGADYAFEVRAITEQGAGQAATSPTVSVDWWLPWSSANTAGTEIYTWLTGKAPTAAQLAAFVSAGNGGQLPGQQIATLRDGADATTNVDPVIRLYSAYFLRPPDKGGFNFWVNRRRAGTWTVAKISASFAGSSEFQNRYGSLTNSQFVRLVYNNVLQRDPDAAGLAYWTKKLDNGTSRGQVMASFSESNEYKSKTANLTDAVSVHIQLLGVSPSKAQVDDLVSAIAGNDLATVIRQKIHEPSFDARAG
ncbi:MAG: DUF4214 domain-containing protein [Acidimicrobiales bacterium]|nr:DUF4214 domain-containing protein [Acidimicrobiales bacterium]